MKNLLFLIACALVFTFPVLAQKQTAYEQFRDEACQAFLKSSTKFNDEFKIGTYSRWDYDQDTGKLIFSDNGIPKVIAEVQAAGSWSNISQTWMWSWNNPSILDSMKVNMGKVRDLGKERNFVELTKAKWSSDPDYAWTMTAVAGHILGAKSAYRAPDGNGYLFLLLFDIKWAGK